MDFRQCKIRYLSNENNWLSLQCYSLHQTSKLYNEVLRKLQNKPTKNLSIIFDQEDKENICPRGKRSEPKRLRLDQSLQQLIQIKKLLQQRLKYCASHIKNLENLENANIEKFADQVWLYYESLQNYDSRLLWINQRIFEKEIMLQNEQGKKNQKRKSNLEQRVRDLQINQVIQGYQAYPKVKQLMNRRKQKLMQRLGIRQRKSGKLTRQLTSMTNVLSQDQNINKRVKFCQKTAKQIEHPTSTVFQCAMLCLRKRKYQNLQLKKQIAQLRKKKEQIDETCRILTTGLQLRANQEIEQKLPEKENIKKMQDQDFSINISKIGGRTYIQSNIQNQDERQMNQCILGNLNGMGYNIKGFTQELWEDIPSLLVD